MKAIQILDVNRELLNSWGVSEELTWDNSFGNLVGSVLVVDSEAFPQGYGVVTNADFYNDYRWVSNFGSHGWSDVEKVSLHDFSRYSNEEPSYLAFARLNVKNGDASSPTIVRELLARIDRDAAEKRALTN